MVPKTGASLSCHPLFSVHFLWSREKQCAEVSALA